jgi:hypothetical protein
MLKFKPIKLKAENQSEKTENRKKSNKFGCAFIKTAESDWIDFSKPIKIEQNRIHIF